MTLLGKIFTVLILVMSVLFMGFAIVVFATHTNWREASLDLKKKYEQELQTNRELQAQQNALRTAIAAEQAARRFALAGLQTKLKETQDQLTQSERVLQNLTATEGTTAAALDVAQKTLVSLTTEVQGLRDEIRTAQQDADSQFAKVVSLTDEINQASRVKQQLEERQGPLLRQVAGLKDVAAKKGVRLDVAQDGTVRSDVDRLPPEVDGVVLGVNDKNLVEISIGSDDGLLVGHELDVYRSNAYLGRMVILKTDRDRAVGEIMPGFTRGKIRKGDRVATKLS